MKSDLQFSIKMRACAYSGILTIIPAAGGSGTSEAHFRFYSRADVDAACLAYKHIVKNLGRISNHYINKAGDLPVDANGVARVNFLFTNFAEGLDNMVFTAFPIQPGAAETAPVADTAV